MASTDNDVVSDDLPSIANKCAYCKRNIAKISVKCNSCTKVFHNSCGLKISKCCDQKFAISSTGEKVNYNSDMNTAVGTDLQVKTPSNLIDKDSGRQELLFKIIAELESKNSILEENIELMNYKISILEDNITKKDSLITQLNKKLNKQTNAGNGNNAKVQQSDRDRHTVTDAPEATVLSTYTAEICEARSPLAEAPTMSKIVNKNKTPEIKSMNKKILIKKDQDPPLNKQVSLSTSVDIKNISFDGEVNNEWKKVSRKRNRKSSRPALVTGTFSGPSAVEGIKKYKALHVTNLKPNTAAEDLTTFLKQNFSEVICKPIKSRFPNSYSSFKVLIPTGENDKVMIESNWPNRSTVHYFHQRKRREEEP